MAILIEYNFKIIVLFLVVSSCFNFFLLIFVWEVIPLHFCEANFCKAKPFAKIATKNLHKSITAELMKATKKGGLVGKK